MSNVTKLHKPPEMMRVEITVFPSRPNVYSWQMITWPDDASGGTVVRRGQSGSLAPLIIEADKFLNKAWE